MIRIVRYSPPLAGTFRGLRWWKRQRRLPSFRLIGTGGMRGYELIRSLVRPFLTAGVTCELRLVAERLSALA